MKVSAGSSLTSLFLIRTIFLSSTIFTIGTFSQKPHCTKEVFITGDTNFTSADSASLTANIDLTGEISLEETICFYVKPELNEDIFKNYEVEIEGDYNESYPLVYALNLTKVTRAYSLSNEYMFAKPSLSFFCVCDCPGGSGHCTEDTDYCANSPGPICVNVLVETLADGCPVSFISTTTCCSVTVSASDDNRYIAYRLGNFETVFDFTLSTFYTSDGTLSEPPRQITAVLNGDRTTVDDDESEISITTNTMDVLDIPTSNLYSSEIGGEIMSDVEVNAINEWDFHKLGWFRIVNSMASVGDTARLEEVVSVSVTNCLEDEYSVTPDVSYDRNDVKPWGSPLSTIAGEQVVSAIYNPLDPSATVNYQESPRMTFELPLRTPAESFFQSGGSRLQDFSIEHVEGGSSIIMKFTGTSGIISGNVLSGSKSAGYKILDDVNFMVPSSSSNEVTVHLTFLSTTEPITRVCLHHVSYPTAIICKQVPLDVTTMKTPPLSPKVNQTMYLTEEVATTHMYIDTSPEYGDNETIEQNSDDISRATGENGDKKRLKWYHYLNPGQWFNGMDNMVEGFMMTLEIILVVIIGILLFLVFKYRKKIAIIGKRN